jgi:CHAD domain-containing protein
VHESRKSLKKVEALARVLEQLGGAPRRKDVKRLRAARRTLSKLRDATVAIETFDRLRSRFARQIPEHTSAMITKHLARSKASMIERAHARNGGLARVADVLKKIRRSAKRWKAPSIDASMLPEVLGRSFRASRKAMRRAGKRERAGDFHEWRKRVKQFWYQLRLAERLISGLGRQIADFRELETALGDEHNLAVIRGYLRHARAFRRMHSDVDRIAAMSTALEAELRRAAMVLGGRLYKRSAKSFVKDLRRRLRSKGAPRRTPSPRTREAIAS